jgi:catechol 2,3-dioxygenase-like lactoylglutathione lyase family enzyme
VLSVFLACDDLYAAARFFTGELGWRLEFQTPADSGDPLACVSLGGAQVMLGPVEERWLPTGSRAHRGAGVTVYVTLGADEDIEGVWRRHDAAGVATSELSDRPWGERAFDAVIEGYRFLISAPGKSGR